MEEHGHIPVMAGEIRDLLAFDGPGWMVDATVGLGGHASILLEASPEATLLGVDRDPEALELAGEKLAPFGNRVKLVHANFSMLPGIMAELDIPPARSILVDLGVSSYQLSRAERGFSFSRPGPLDMRMDPSSGQSLEKILSKIKEDDLARVIRQYGEEKRARAISRKILAEYRAGNLKNTRDLADSIASVCGPRRRSEKTHPATRAMQALRILVNQELDALEKLLESTRALLGLGGRIAVLTFHSIEDRMVKRWIAAQVAHCTCPPELPVCRCGSSPPMRLLSRGEKASPEEIDNNPRARSVRLRAAERLR